jgi:hypothetical protein
MPNIAGKSREELAEIVAEEERIKVRVRFESLTLLYRILM